MRAMICAGLAIAGAARSQPAPPATPAPTLPIAANLTINPKRLVFDRLGNAAAIYLFNQGTAPSTFDVALIDRVMLPDGEIVPVSDGATRPEVAAVAARLHSARPLLLATPRRLTLAPGAGQTVRVRASGSDVPPGEYRTHLTVTAIPPPDSGFTAEDAAKVRSGQLSFRIDTVIGLSIPVIVRVGPADIRAALVDPKIKLSATTNVNGNPAPGPVLYVDLVRVGVNALFGDLEVRGSKERGDREPLGAVRGIGVYPEIDRRALAVALRRLPQHGEAIEIVFRDDDASPGKVLAKVTLPAP